MLIKYKQELHLVINHHRFTFLLATKCQSHSQHPIPDFHNFLCGPCDDAMARRGAKAGETTEKASIPKRGSDRYTELHMLLLVRNKTYNQISNMSELQEAETWAQALFQN